MAILKCKICDGDMEVSSDKSFGTCENYYDYSEPSTHFGHETARFA